MRMLGINYRSEGSLSGLVIWRIVLESNFESGSSRNVDACRLCMSSSLQQSTTPGTNTADISVLRRVLHITHIPSSS
jgi:hypothetical protein